MQNQEKCNVCHEKKALVEIDTVIIYLYTDLASKTKSALNILERFYVFVVQILWINSDT
jgi:hypothetical protein